MAHLDDRILLSAKKNEGTEKFLRKSLVDTDAFLLDYLKILRIFISLGLFHLG